jgi:allene oxide cyclase
VLKCGVWSFLQLYDGSLKLRLGITAGICLLMKHYPGMGTPEMKRQQFFFPDRYETLMTWYFGDFGHISGQVRLSISSPIRRIYT